MAQVPVLRKQVPRGWRIDVHWRHFQDAAAIGTELPRNADGVLAGRAHGKKQAVSLPRTPEHRIGEVLITMPDGPISARLRVDTFGSCTGGSVRGFDLQ